MKCSIANSRAFIPLIGLIYYGSLNFIHENDNCDKNIKRRHKNFEEVYCKLLFNFICGLNFEIFPNSYIKKLVITQQENAFVYNKKHGI